MTNNTTKTPGLASRLVNTVLSIKPLADFAKNQARKMMIQRAEAIGVPWRENVKQLRSHDWEKEIKTVQNPQLTYPDYYLTSFHGYEKGNLSWDAAFEVESAAYAVHAKIWPEAGAQGDSKLRQSYHDVLQKQIAIEPKTILDLGCGVGMSTLTLQQIYPEAKITGVDLSPYFLAVAQHLAKEKNASINLLHSAAEATILPDNSFDFVSASLVFHELPQAPAVQILREVRRLLRLGGYFALMDMNPDSQFFRKLPPYILTLLKSTEPYLDQYMTLNIKQALIEAGFQTPTIISNSPRHRTILSVST
ncbi:MAG: class I SAM-dependent methyltransferase [Prochloron sp. SP5CPC1]|nr:class I SAM-dependent methyltransferase [Candidatus Paraprochloron terpiosi SP5CPC1]